MPPVLKKADKGGRQLILMALAEKISILHRVNFFLWSFLFQLFMELPWVFFQEVNYFLKLEFWGVCYNLVKVFPSPLAKKPKNYSSFLPPTPPHPSLDISASQPLTGLSQYPLLLGLQLLQLGWTQVSACQTYWPIGLYHLKPWHGVILLFLALQGGLQRHRNTPLIMWMLFKIQIGFKILFPF